MEDWEQVAKWADYYRSCLAARRQEAESDEGVRFAGTVIIESMRWTWRDLGRVRRFYLERFGHDVLTFAQHKGEYSGKEEELRNRTAGLFARIAVQYLEYDKAVRVSRAGKLKGRQLLHALYRGDENAFMRVTAESVLLPKDGEAQRQMLFQLAGWCAAKRGELREEIFRELPAQVLSIVATRVFDDIERLPYRAVKGTRIFVYGRNREYAADMTAIEEFRPAEFDPLEDVLARLIAREELEERFSSDELDTLLLAENDYSYEEIANRRGETPAAVSQRLYRARKRVRPKSEPS